jgi:hypothetical protein
MLRWQPALMLPRAAPPLVELIVSRISSALPPPKEQSVAVCVVKLTASQRVVFGLPIAAGVPDRLCKKSTINTKVINSDGYDHPTANVLKDLQELPTQHLRN